MRAAIFLLVAFAAAASAQSTSLPPSTTEPDVRRLAAQLGVTPGQGLPKFSPEQLKALKQLMEGSLKDRNYLENLKQQMEKNPAMVEQLKKDNPDLVKDFKEQFPNVKVEPTIPKPGETGDPNTKPDPENVPPFPPKQNFPNKPNPSENREYQEMAKLWEQAVGPLDDTPAVKQALIEMFSGASSSKPGEKPFWADWDMKDGKGGPSSSGFAKWLQGLTKGNNGNTKLNMPKWFGGKPTNFKPPSMDLPTAPKMPSFGFSGFDLGLGSVSGLGSAGIALLVVLATALIAFLLWKFAPQLGLAKARKPKPLPGLGPWPIDPRTITDRAGLVQAFEYMSVLLCGDGARVWNHATIAEALRDSVPAAAPFADPLAKLYALARYTPHSEQLSVEAIGEARGYLCQLAGVPAS